MKKLVLPYFRLALQPTIMGEITFHDSVRNGKRWFRNSSKLAISIQLNYLFFVKYFCKLVDLLQSRDRYIYSLILKRF